jgi:hypothetical protein
MLKKKMVLVKREDTAIVNALVLLRSIPFAFSQSSHCTRCTCVILTTAQVGLGCQANNAYRIIQQIVPLTQHERRSCFNHLSFQK